MVAVMDAMQLFTFNWMLCMRACLVFIGVNAMHCDIDVERLEIGMILDSDIILYCGKNPF